MNNNNHQSDSQDLSALRLYLIEFFDGSMRRYLAQSLEDAISYLSLQDQQDIKGITEVPQ